MVNERVDWSLVEKGIGWSRKSWTWPLRKFRLEHPDLLVDSALEIGVSALGTTAPFLRAIARHVTVSYYTCDEVGLAKKLRSVHCDDVSVQQADLRALTGQYDLIIAKSVVGGIFKEDNSTLDEVRKFMASVVSENLRDGGYLLLLDNGKSAFEGLLAPFGARKYHWRYFRPEDYGSCYRQYTFGFFSVFSFETKLGKLGYLLDWLTYLVDLLVSPLIVSDKTVILTVYKKTKR